MAGRERMKLTDAAIARLRPREQEYTVWDSRVAGLGVRVRPSGGRSYVLLHEVGGRSKRISLGPADLSSTLCKISSRQHPEDLVFSDLVEGLVERESEATHVADVLPALPVGPVPHPHPVT